MNDGYLFIIIGWMVFILMVTHWLDFIWEDERALGGQRRRACLFLLLVMIGQAFYVPLSSEMMINIGSMVCIPLLFLYRIWTDPSPFRLQMIAVVIFLGVFYALSYELFAMDPILMIISPIYLVPLAFTLFLTLTTQSVQQQWLMMTGGFVLGEWLHKSLQSAYADVIYIGDALFRDQLAIGFVFVTASAYTTAYILKLSRYMLKLLRPQSKQEG